GNGSRSCHRLSRGTLSRVRHRTDEVHVNSTNLLPLARQLRQTRSTRARVWGIAASTILALSVATYAGCAFALSDSTAPSPADFSRTARELAVCNGEASRIKAQLTAAQRETY